MNTTTWHEETIEQVRHLFAGMPAVQALAVFGSSYDASALRDEWSDLDIVVVVDTSALSEYHPNTEWLDALGEIYTYEQSSGPFTHVTRCCFRDGRKIDFVFVTAETMENTRDWPQLPWWNGAQVLFSRSETASAAFAHLSTPPTPALMNSKAFAAMIHAFRFKGLLAIDKIARNDLLIAQHLILAMQQDYCVLGMLLRDRITGTSHHRKGGIGNELITRLPIYRFPGNAEGLLDSIEQLVPLFDDLAFQWSEDYIADTAPIRSAIERVRRSVRKNLQ